jgi:Icc protein
VIIAQVSDTHLTVDAPGSDHRMADLRAVIDDINTLDPAPDLIVHSGDIVQTGSAAEYAAAADILGRARAPVYVMVGNKDDRESLRETFPAHAYLSGPSDFIEYSVEDFPVRLLMLDTVSPGSRKGDFCRRRLAHFEELVARDLSRPIAVFAHHPPYEVLVGPEPYHYDDLTVMERFAAALNASGRVIALFGGHVHRPFFARVGSVPASVMPAVATALRFGDYPVYMKTRPTYFVHRYDAREGFTTATHLVGGWSGAHSGKERSLGLFGVAGA